MDELLNYVLQLIEYVETHSEQLNEETQRELAVFLQEVMEFISEYQNQNPTETLSPTTPQNAELEPGPYPSSNINAFRYDPDSGRLLVKFHGKDTADSGPIYGYQGVPEHIFDIFRRGAVAPRTSGKNKYHQWYRGVTPSLGASMYALIKQGNYPYQRLS